MNARTWGIIGGLALVLALLSPYVLGSSKKVGQLFEAAETLYEKSDYEAAIAKYEEALKESNKLLARTETIDEDFTTLVNFKIAMSYVKLAEQFNDTNYYEKALEYIEQAVSSETFAGYQEDLMYLWGYILYKTEQTELALEKLKQLIENYPNSPFVQKAQEIIAQINEQVSVPEEGVVQQLNHVPVWAHDPSKFEAFNKKRNRTLVVPNRLRAEEQYAEAAKQYEIFANANPVTVEASYALYWSGWCYHEAASNDNMLFSKSRDVFEKLIDNHGDNPYTIKAREKLRDMGNSEQEDKSGKAIINAEEAVYNARQSDSKSDAISEAIKHLDEAKQKHEQENYIEAEQLAKKASDIAKSAVTKHETAKRYVNQGYNYLRQGRLESATEKAKEALRIDPPYQDARKLLEEIKQKYFNQGVNYIQAQEYTKAILFLQKALDMGLRSKEVYFNIGRAYVKLGEFEEGKTFAEAALAIDPTYKDARMLRDSIAD